MEQNIFVKLLPYERDSAKLFTRIAGLSGAVFLDSNCFGGSQGRFDILAALPQAVITSRNGVTTVKKTEGTEETYKGNPLDVVRRYLEPINAFEAYPFLTGVIGYFAYDLGRQFENLPELVSDEDQLPEMLLGIYDWAVIVDHAAQQTTLIGLHNKSMVGTDFADIYAMLTCDDTGRVVHPFKVTSELVCNMDKQEYLCKFSRVMDYVHAGDCYQVNLAQKFSVQVEGDSWQAYRRLRQLNAAPFSAYLNFGGFGNFQVLSISPERFLQIRAGHIVAKPIKGTRPRLQDDELDCRQIEQLQNSNKDRAENLMIVDLIRNDVSKNCRFASVRVSDLFAVETFANVHHLVSTIEGDLREDKDALDLLEGCFPGGSITGAPKLRAMQIIEELEPDRRNVYCGAIGYLSRHGDMDLSIAIRTAVRQGNQFSFYGGGGIVADSDGEAEYQETLDKVSSLFSLLSEQGIVSCEQVS